MPSVEVEIEVYCKGCGRGMCNNTRVGKTNGRGQEYFDVEPCEYCLDKAKEEGKKEGYDEGYEEARKEFEKE